MIQYRVQQGESPTIIAFNHGVTLAALVRANPQKPTTVVAGKQTFRDIAAGEVLNVPAPGTVQDAFGDMINTLIATGGPCIPSNAPFVCGIQEALGVSPDGKWGSTTATAAKARAANAPPACSPRPAWWAPPGQSNCTVTAPPPPITIPTNELIDPCAQANVARVCDLQRRLGLTVDGKYGTETAAKAKELIANAPPPCSPRPAWWAAPGQSNCGMVPAPTPAPVPTPTPQPAPVPSPTPTRSVPAAVLALVGVDLCSPASVQLVCAAQAALGVTVDGKYGSGTAAAAKAILPNAPAGCSPRPSWWLPAGQSNCTGKLPAPVPTPIPAPVPVPKPPQPAPVPEPGVPAPRYLQHPELVALLRSSGPCDPTNVALVCAAQKVIGVTVDGKFGDGTSKALKEKFQLSIPACSPRPAWWKPAGQSNCTSAPAPKPPGPVPPAPPKPKPTPTKPTDPTKPTTDPTKPAEIVVPPEEKKGLSTGAIVAGGLGAVALVGLVALAATSGKKGHTGRRGKPGRAGKSRKAPRKAARRSKKKR